MAATWNLVKPQSGEVSTKRKNVRVGQRENLEKALFELF